MSTTISSHDSLKKLPPNGGLVAWVQVLGSFFMFFASWGMLNSFGMFQTFFEGNLLSAHTPSQISWIGTVQGFLVIVVGVLSGPLFDKGFLKTLIFAGMILSTGGLVATSFASQYHEIFLSLGVAVGLGSGLLYVPSVAILNTYFTTMRPLATSIAATGGSIGGVVLPIVFRSMVDRTDYAWACRVIGLIVAGLLSFSLLVAQPLEMDVVHPKRSLIDKTAFRDVPFIYYILALFFVFMTLDIPHFYIAGYAEKYLELPAHLASHLLTIINGAALFGRIIPGLAAVYCGTIPVLLFSVLVTSIISYVWSAIADFPSIIAFAILYGFFSGAVVSLPNVALMTLSPDTTVVGARLGMSLILAGFGLLVGNPIAGIDKLQDHRFAGVSVFTGTSFMIGFGLILVAYIKHLNASKRSGEMVKWHEAL